MNHRKRERFLRRIRITLLILLVAGLAFGAYHFGNFRSTEAEDEGAVSAPTSSFVAPNIQIFNSPYFQFQANNSWAEDPTNTRDGKYVYRSMRGNLIEQQLTVYVNNFPSDLAVTRVMGANIGENNSLNPIGLSDHCGQASGYKGGTKKAIMNDVSFTCFSDDTRYTVLVGLKGGTTNMSLPRPDGSSAAYSIYYSNVTADPEASQLHDIVNSFQTR